MANLYKEGDFKRLSKILLKAYNKNYTDILDKHFILKNITLVYKKMKLYDISKYYLNLALENIKDKKETYSIEYYDLQWLYIELNKDDLNEEQMINIYEEMVKYHKERGNKRHYYVLQNNLYLLRKEYYNMESLLIDVCNDDFILRKDAINEILQDFKTLGDTYYNIALKIINKSNANNFITL